MRRVLRELMSEYKNLSRGNTSLYDIETTCGPVPADRYGSTQGPFESCVVAVLKGQVKLNACANCGWGSNNNKTSFCKFLARYSLIESVRNQY